MCSVSPAGQGMRHYRDDATLSNPHASHLFEGELRRPALGVTMVPATASLLDRVFGAGGGPPVELHPPGQSWPAGLFVAGVAAGSPAARAGLQSGDLAVALDGETLRGGTRQLLAALGKDQGAETAHTLRVLRREVVEGQRRGTAEQGRAFAAPPSRWRLLELEVSSELPPGASPRNSKSGHQLIQNN